MNNWKIVGMKIRNQEEQKEPNRQPKKWKRTVRKQKHKLGIETCDESSDQLPIVKSKFYFVAIQCFLNSTKARKLSMMYSKPV